jgi:hypothetical protein
MAKRKVLTVGTMVRSKKTGRIGVVTGQDAIDPDSVWVRYLSGYSGEQRHLCKNLVPYAKGSPDV